MLHLKVKSLAGKTNPDDSNEWLPLWMHGMDTAGIIRRLYQNWIPESVRYAIGLDEELAANTLSFLGLVHDLGKATALFQRNILIRLPEARERLKNYLIIPETFTQEKATTHALASEAILILQRCPRGLASVAGAHHGKPQQDRYEDCIDEQVETYPENYFGKQEKEWKQIWDILFDMALGYAGFSKVSELPALTISQEILITGLLIMADWIASNVRYFPLISVDDLGEECCYPDRIDAAWKKLNFSFPWESSSLFMSMQMFEERFGFQPNEVQKDVISVLNDIKHPGLFILEAQMGVGKTEAALAAAEVFAAKSANGGIYFGLPTQATANGIFLRLLSWAQKQSEETEHSVRLAHGMAEFNEDYRELIEGRAVCDEENEDGGVFVHQWFCGNKQALLADFVIGTVDQLLMAGLKQKHVMLRHLGLAGKVVIIDEVHAYDAYMNQYLDMVLRWLGKYRVPVILMSATLPDKRRKELISCYKNVPLNEFSESSGYPLITWTDGEKIQQKAVPVSEKEKVVKLRYENENNLPEILQAALKDGGCAGVIVNTVKKAQALAGLLRDKLPECEVFLFHAQFLMPDRTEKEQELLKRLGKKSKPEDRDRLIVVGTQVLEQSLDIDFDFLVTELCPMDLLLQRIGREHRHVGRTRPNCLQNAECAVLCPEDGFDLGSEAVYGKWLLWRTKELLPDKITLPWDIPELVQSTYNWEENDVLPQNESSIAFCEEYCLLQKEKMQRAKAYVISKPDNREKLDSWMKDEGAKSEQAARAAVRDGEPSIEVLVMMQKEDGRICFLPWQEDGREIPFDCQPNYEDSLKIARQRLRLPAAFSKKWNIDKIIKELEEENIEKLSSWQFSSRLKGELVLLLDNGLSKMLGGNSIHYDRENGLTYEKGE